MSSRLAQLAALQGVDLEYRDIWGQPHRAPDASLIAVLEAMGVAADGADAVEASIAAHETTRWRSVLDPVVVASAEASEHSIILRLPAALDHASLQWIVHEEHGRRHAGEILPSELPAVEQAIIDGTRYIARVIVLRFQLPPGYHRLEIAGGGTTNEVCMLIAAPRVCHWPVALGEGSKAWGAAVQLYGVRSARNWGIGDYSDLRTIVAQWGAEGGGFVSVNPLHALFPHDPARASPYSPSSRLFKNALYLDVEAIEDFDECSEARELAQSAAFRATLASLRAAEFVDYPAVAAVKFSVLELLFAHFRARHLDAGSARAQSFRDFQHAGGDTLRRHALFEALQERLHRDDPSIWGWPAWPDAYRDPGSPECVEFLAAHSERVEFYEYLQWQADDQLAAIGLCAKTLGLGVGVCHDLAISVDRGGAETWANRRLYAVGASVGAPPDEFSPRGQDWGLPPIVPQLLRAARYVPFIATLRANMRHAGALRIDHVMGLARLFWVPGGGVPADGVYVRYPFADLLGIVALESQRNRCVVIGEDLGTVPDEVRTALGATGVLSYRLLYFERNHDGEFRAPAEYPAQALAAATTHDLPTLAGWWDGLDISRRAEIGLLPSADVRDAQLRARAEDRVRLLRALAREELLSPGATTDPASLPAMTPDFARAIAVFLARSTAKILAIQLEDVLGVREQANLPGTVAEHPNWRRKLPLALECWPDDERFVDLVRALVGVRDRVRSHRTSGAHASVAIVPRATYRLQLNRDFRFVDATAIVPYLADLGVSHVYCSPYLRARSGSRHGYDIVSHAELNPEIGSTDDFDRFVAALKRHGMGQVFDMVPNHMAVMGASNEWWMDVLENGPASPYAAHFDIDWHSLDPTLAGKVLVPVLGDHYGNVLERGELVLGYEAEGGSFALTYFEHRFPIDPREYPSILAELPGLLCDSALPAQAAAELESLIVALGRLPPRDATGAEALAERRRDSEVHKVRLAKLANEHPDIAEAIARSVRRINGVAGKRESYRALDALLEAQAFRVAYWRVAADEINYRRFFDVDDLAALRAENEAVFESTHRFALGLAAAGIIDGLRIDHPDGLYDPAEYFRRIQETYRRLVGGAVESAKADSRPLYLVIEKILAPHEQLPQDWRVHGTTGYPFANLVNGLCVDAAAKSRVDRTWRAFVGDEAIDFEEAAYLGKRLVMKNALGGELTVLANHALRIARADWRTRDFTFSSLRQAIAEVVGWFPVYRTYIAEHVSTQDERQVERAVAQARRHTGAADPSVFDFIGDALLARAPADATRDETAEYRRFAMRFQQFSAPVMAKGVEDTAFYVFNRLLSMNDVGGDPDHFGTTVSAFHVASAERMRWWPHTMLATTTHDSKRSEDARARIDVISELTASWRLAVRGWSRMNRSKKRKIDGRSAPSRNDEYLFYQTLIGTFPVGDIDASALAAYRERIDGYMLKAIREAKLYTSWINPNEQYESATAAFVHALLGRIDGNAFLDEFRTQLVPFAWFGALNSVSMAVVKFTSPGVPDIYQGQERIELTLVDPDNRRAVDYVGLRRELSSLKALATAAPDELATRVRSLFQVPHDGRAKLWVAWRLLQLRRKRPAVFEHGDYHPIVATGTRAQHVVAYSRRHRSAGIIAIAGRLFAGLGLEHGSLPVGSRAWADTLLDLSSLRAGARLENVLTGETLIATGDAVPLAQLLAQLPVAVFAYEAAARA